MKELGTQQVKRLQELYRAVAGICAEVGCTCLAERFNSAMLASESKDVGVCPACMGQTSRVLPHYLAKLVPLIEVLHKAGYHDLALLTTELALQIEPTIDLRFNYAYLALVLGETEEAVEIYRNIVNSRGSIPAAEINRLLELAATHAAEEDIAEVCRELHSHISPRSA
jgi:tetratricopeptide (TPR) repeat protein